jgi:hypothetical protein
VTLAIIIIALLVLLVIVDGSDTSGAHHGAPHDAEVPQGEDQAASACILNVTSVLSRRPQEQRRQPWKPARQEQTQTTQR